MNHLNLHKKFIALTLSTLCLTTSSLTFAGLDFLDFMPESYLGKCTQTGNIMSCNGSFRAIRAQEKDPYRWAAFFISNSVASVTMNYNETIYRCVAPNTQAWKDLFITATASSYFTVTYKVNTGVCDSLTIQEGSQFKNLSAL